MITYEEAMADPRQEAVEEGLKVEHDKMMKAKVWDEIHKDDLLPTNKVLDTTCAIKPKPNRTMRSRVVVRGHQQKKGLQYDKLDLSAPVLNLVAIKIVLVFVVMASWHAHILNVKGAFLLSKFLRHLRNGIHHVVHYCCIRHGMVPYKHQCSFGSKLVWLCII